MVSDVVYWWRLPLAITLGTINFIVVVGNIFVLYILISQKSLHTSTNFVVLSLTLADFMLGVMILPFSIIQEYYQEWIYGERWCKSWLALDVLFSTASIYNLLAISFDRYMAVRQPIKYRFISSNRMTKMTISIVWITSAAIAMPPLIYDTFLQEAAINRGYDKYTCTPMTSNHMYIIFSAMVSFILPTILMVIFNVSIFQTVHVSRRLQMPQPSRKLSDGTDAREPPNANQYIRIHRGGRSNTLKCRRKRLSDEIAQGPPKQLNTVQLGYQNASPDFAIRRLKRRSISENNLHSLSADNGLESQRSPVIQKKKLLASNDKPQQFTKADKMFSKNQSEKKNSQNKAQSRWRLVFKENIQKTESKLAFRRMLQSEDSLERRSLRTELRVARTIGIVVGCFVVCWLPFTIIYLLQAYETCAVEKCLANWLFTTAFWLGYANSAVNPLLYAAVSRDFRTTFKRVLFGKKRGVRC